LRTSSTSQPANKKQEFVKSDDKKEDKEAGEKKMDMSKVKCYNCKKEGHFAKDCKKAKNIMITLGMFKLSVSQSVSPISMSKTSCNSKNVENLDTFSSVRRPKQSSVIWKKLCDLFDENNLFIFDDESVRISPVSNMPFRKKPRDSMNVRSKSNSNKSLPRTVHMWLPKMQPLVEPVAKWIPRIVQIYLWIIDSGCSKHMTGNRALLKNFVEKFLGTVRFGNNDFAMIVGYGDVFIGSMTIKKVYYVEGLGHNLFNVGQYCDNGLEIMKSSTTNVESSNVEVPLHEEEVFHESSESFQEESSSSSLNDDVQQSSEEVGVPSSNIQSILNNMIPNVDEASISHNVFNERLEDA
nr:integrase, catalytic region, zinc finger, CCHC-type, peptidase aspartic, catalytic [Tanacetum cinerariifolium]